MSNKIITPEYRNVILNILSSLSNEALIDSIKEPIIRVNKNRDIIVVGVTKKIKVLTVLTDSGGRYVPGNEIVFEIYILRSLSGVWILSDMAQEKGYLLNVSMNDGMLAIGVIFNTQAKVILHSLYDARLLTSSCIYDPNLSEGKGISSFGSSISISRDSKKIYISDPIGTELHNHHDLRGRLIKNPGVVYEWSNIEISGYRITRIFSLTNKYLEDKNHIGLGCKLELKNNDNTLCMTCFDGSVFSYILNQPKDVEFDYSENNPKVCYIDDLVEINNV